MKRRLYLLSLTILFCAASVSAQIRYVKPTGSDANDGLSWATPFQTLQRAIANVPPGGKVFVAVGTYYPDEGNYAIDNSRISTFFLHYSIEMYGGFEPELGIDDLSDTRTKRSRLSGDLMQDDYLGASNYLDNAYSVVTVQASGTTILDGFTISDGYNNGLSPKGAGMSLTLTSPVIRNCNFTNNTATDGAAIYVAGSSSATILNCNFSANHASNAGGAIYNSSLTITTITSCSFSANSATQYGGAIFNNITTPSLTNCYFSIT